MAEFLSPREEDRTTVPGVWMIDEKAGTEIPAEGLSPSPRLNDGEDSVGNVLRNARLEQGAKPISEIAQDLRIRPHLLEALEADDYDKLPGLIYAAGFLRAYAQYLGLDGASLVERLKESGRAQTLEAQLVFPEPLEDPRIPRRPIVVMACLMALTVYGAWYGFSSRDGAQLSEVTAPGPEFQAALRASESAPAPQKPVEEAPTAPVEEISRSEPERHIASAPAFESQPQADPAGAEPQQITLKARSDAWVRIEGPDETLFVDTVLKAGEEVKAPTDRGFVMMTGNAGALEVMVDGKALGFLGPQGAIRREVSLERSVLVAELVQNR